VRARCAGAAVVAALALAAAPARAAERFDAGDPAAARAAARDVLSDGDFTRREPPRPFRSLFERLGDLIDDLIAGVDVGLPGGLGIAAAALAALVLLGASLAAARGVRRRARVVVAEGEAARPARDDPVALERAARDAEASGDHEQAVRLRFRAGLLRLGAARALAYRPSLTSGEVARQVHSAAFERLAADLDEIAYGGRPAGPDDVAAATEGWPRVLEEARRSPRAPAASGAPPPGGGTPPPSTPSQGSKPPGGGTPWAWV
jgi:Domain of unknown function (DUF4129)